MQDQDKTREQLVEELVDLRQRLGQLQRFCGDLDAFAYTVAHDLKRPLSLILGYSDLLMSDSEAITGEELTESIRVISQSAQKMNGIINDLMLLVHVRDDEGVALKSLDMGNIVTEALARLDYIIQRRGVKISQPTQLPQAVGYAPWIEEVWYTFIGEILRLDVPSLQIEIGAARDRDMTRFWVRVDDGHFTPNQQARLAQVIGNFKSDLVKRVLKNLGGTFGKVGEIGRGGELYFSLPSKEQD